MDIISKYFLAMLFMMGFLLIWFFVQNFARKFAQEHPEFGKVREEGGGCGGSGKCNCNSVSECVYPKSKK